MDYLQPLQYHYKHKKGWMNDPNGLVFFDGYYHVFYQHAPDYEIPWKQPMHWGHARTRDFLAWEELPVALTPEHDYERNGCWSGTAIAKDGVLYLFYASVRRDPETRVYHQTVSVAYSTDGIHFEKYAHNPVIDRYPPEGSVDFRDPAVCLIDGSFYCVMASGNPEAKMARLLLYRSEDLFSWEYRGVMCEWESGKFAECPSLMQMADGTCLLTASVCPLEGPHYFSVMHGRFVDGVFRIEASATPDKGPDQYAGQAFCDDRGRCLLLAWIPGWSYAGFASRDVGCMSLPRELTVKDGRIYAYPPAELQHLLRDSDPSVQRTERGFVISREGRAPVVYEGEIRELKVLRDGYLVEVFVNGGEAVYTVLL